MIVRFCSKIKKKMDLIASSEKMFKAFEFIKMKRKPNFYINRLIFKIKTPAYTPPITVMPFEIKELSFNRKINRGRL